MTDHSIKEPKTKTMSSRYSKGQSTVRVQDIVIDKIKEN